MKNNVIKQGVLYFNNNSSLDLDLYITDYPEIKLNNEVYEEQEIEGKDGSVYNDLGYYKDRKLSFSFDLKGNDLEERIEKVKIWLRNINDNRLIFNSNKCRIVKKVLMNSFKQINAHLAELEIEFIVDPFLYDPEEITITSTTKNFSIYNNGTQEADTIIKIYSTGSIQITCNDETMQIDDVSDYVLLDSKCKECVSSTGKSKDWDTIGNYIKLDPGDNTFELTGSITKIEIIYRNTYL